jgi:signal peptidase II
MADEKEPPIADPEPKAFGELEPPDAPAAPPEPAAPDAGAGPYRSPAPKEPSPKPWHPSYVFLAVVTIANLGADLWTKHWAKTRFESYRPGEAKRFVVLEDYLSLIFAKNKGGAWGLLQNETESLRRPFFLIVSVAAIVFIVSLYRKLQPGQRALKWGLPLVLGGALGNLIDRIRFGYVVDFIDVYMKVDNEVKHWPTFNVADIAICVGVGLMAIDMFTSRAKKPKKSGAPDSLPSPSSAAAPAPEAPPAPAADGEARGGP